MMEYKTELMEIMPPMLTGIELISSLAVLPEYNPDIKNENQAIRLMALSELYQVYVPTQMSLEVYSKLYLALLRSLQKKNTKIMIQQQNENYKAIMNMKYTGIMGGADVFTIIGASGIGKSTAISRALDLITENRVFSFSSVNSKIIPCLVIQCPYDSSVKGMLLEILRKVDIYLESNFYQNAIRARATTDMLIGSVSQIALNHVGLLIVDEIQNVVNSKNGKSLVGMLTQLINNSGISICMVGTPESTRFFSQAMQLARRSLGLQYGAMEYGEDFKETVRILFKYQFLKNDFDITEGIIEWLYQHSTGNISVLVSLIHDAQEIAIMNGTEKMDIRVLKEAYKKRLALLRDYIETSDRYKAYKKPSKATESNMSEQPKSEESAGLPMSISEICNMAKVSQKDIVPLIRAYYSVEEVYVS